MNINIQSCMCRLRTSGFRQQDSFVWGTLQERTQHVALLVLHCTYSSQRSDRVHWTWKLCSFND